MISIYEKSFGKFKKTKQYETNLYDEKDFIDWLNFLYDLKKIDSWYEVGIYYLEKDPSEKNKILNNINQFYKAKKKSNKISFLSKSIKKFNFIYIYDISLFFKQIFFNNTNYKNKKVAKICPSPPHVSLSIFLFIAFLVLINSHKIFSNQEEILYWFTNLPHIISIFLFFLWYLSLKFIKYKIDYRRKKILKAIKEEDWL
ncbi:hypothetical protein [Mycoplasmopsis pulmonis]|uniref:hypothetical protein n=1 Tax=Mycoplasmopsis pulmonis TaxID=2107 RepID=UPI00215BC07D|nr:hypothetical protein [Mycoplasmopsis pulmonis]MDZ7293710.1 hypothetical protein [Mycoplasmopsis pulmonis]